MSIRNNSDPFYIPGGEDPRKVYYPLDQTPPPEKPHPHRDKFLCFFFGFVAATMLWLFILPAWQTFSLQSPTVTPAVTPRITARALGTPKPTVKNAFPTPKVIVYIGNRSTKKFHKSTCGSVKQMSPSNKITFSNRDEAVRKEYVPCQKCHP